MPGADRIVIEEKRLRDTLAAPAFIEKNKCIGPAREPVFSRSVPGKLDQVPFGFGIEKSSANHAPMGILAAVPRKRFFGYSVSQGIILCERRFCLRQNVE